MDDQSGEEGPGEHQIVERFSAAVRTESLDQLPDVLNAWWDRIGDVPLQERFLFETAVVEIANNIVEHSFALEGANGRCFNVLLVADDDGFEATLSDNGKPHSVDLSAVTMADEFQESGRGLAIALVSLDRLDYSYENGFNTWKLALDRTS